MYALGFSPHAYPRIHSPCVSSPQVMARVMEMYRPNVVVLQCGADSLTGDRLGVFNLTLHGHAECVKYMRVRRRGKKGKGADIV